VRRQAPSPKNSHASPARSRAPQTAAPFLALLSFLSLLAAGSTAIADLVITQKLEGSNQNGTLTIKLRDGKVRTDLNSQVSTITDPATGIVTTLIHSQRSFIITTPNTTGALLDRLPKPPADQPRPTLKSEDRKETIEGHPCDVYSWKDASLSATYWLTNDYPALPAIRAALDSLAHGPLSELAKHLPPRPSELPGLALKTELLIQGQKITTTLLSAKETPVDPALFAPPKAYTELKKTPAPKP